MRGRSASAIPGVGWVPADLGRIGRRWQHGCPLGHDTCCHLVRRSGGGSTCAGWATTAAATSGGGTLVPLDVCTNIRLYKTMDTVTPTDQIDAIALLDEGLAWAAERIAFVDVDHLDAPTPCEGWTLRDLLDHVLDTVGVFADAIAGPAATPQAPGTWSTSFAELAARIDRGWTDPEAIDRTYDLRFGLMPEPIMALENTARKNCSLRRNASAARWFSAKCRSCSSRLASSSAVRSATRCSRVSVRSCRRLSAKRRSMA